MPIQQWVRSCVALALCLAACSTGTANQVGPWFAASDASQRPETALDSSSEHADTSVADTSGADTSVADADATADATALTDAPDQAQGEDTPQVQDSAEVADTAPPSWRDWASYPAVLQRAQPTELWLLGDIHGDYARLTKLLSAAGLSNSPKTAAKAKWLGGTATLVVLGDMVDKGKDSLQVLEFVQNLQGAAQAAGGEVVVLLGNHEAEFLADPTAPKVSDFAGELLQNGIDPQAVAAGTAAPGGWLRNLPLAVRVGSWFACHAGDTHGQTLEQIEVQLEQGLSTGGFGAPALSADDSLLEARLAPPWWEGQNSDPETVLTTSTTALGVQHLVQGHQPGDVQFADGSKRKAGKLFQKFGQVFLVDVGMSAAVGFSTGALLHVHHKASGDTATVVTADGAENGLWP